MNESSLSYPVASANHVFFCYLLPETYPLLPTRECIINALLPGAYFGIVWALWERSELFFVLRNFYFVLIFIIGYYVVCARERCKVWCMRMKGSMCLFIKHSPKKWKYLWIMAIDLVTAEIFNSCLCWNTLWTILKGIRRWSLLFELAESEIFMKNARKPSYSH